MDSIVLEWLSLAFRWIHIITAIAWIGASFYFNWLLNHLRSSADPKISGQLWALHAGGFFNVEKRHIDPGQLPTPLHWFKWESYWTWLSGFTLLIIVYYFGAESYLIDPNVFALKPWQAIGISLATLAGGWLVYHGLWRTQWAETHRQLATILTVLFIALMSFVLTHVFSGRGAFLQIGAMLATWMTGNVFFVIMSAQHQLVKATQAGQPQDPRLAQAAGERSLHNNYLTLPVLFCMISNHYPATFGSPWNWLILLGLFGVGVLVRHYFNVREKRGNLRAAWLLLVALFIFIAVALLGSYPQVKLLLAPTSAIAYEPSIKPIVAQHCLSCHSAHPTNPAFPIAPKGVLLDTEQQLRSHAALVATQVSTNIMPLGNITQMTEAERAILVQWAMQQNKAN